MSRFIKFAAICAMCFSGSVFAHGHHGFGGYRHGGYGYGYTPYFAAPYPGYYAAPQPYYVPPPIPYGGYIYNPGPVVSMPFYGGGWGHGGYGWHGGGHGGHGWHGGGHGGFGRHGRH